MKPFFCRLLIPGAFVSTAASSHAHPGHDGHELTWDMGHLAAHPLATIGCLAVFGAAGWLGWRIVKSIAARRREPVIRGQSK